MKSGFEIESILLWNHWYYSERIQLPVFGAWYVSHQIFACSFTSIELLSWQGRVIASSLFSQFNYQKCQWRSSQCWSYYCENRCRIKASWCVFKHMNLDQFLKRFWKYKAAFSTIYLTLSAGLIAGVSTATCEASFSSVVRILTPYRRFVTHDRTGA